MVCKEICSNLMRLPIDRIDVKYGPKTEYLTVCCPCYNEDIIELEKTFRSLLKNFEFMKVRVRFADDEFGQFLKEKFRNLALVIVPIFDGTKALSDSCKRWLGTPTDLIVHAKSPQSKPSTTTVLTEFLLQTKTSME